MTYETVGYETTHTSRGRTAYRRSPSATADQASEDGVAIIGLHDSPFHGHKQIARPPMQNGKVSVGTPRSNVAGGRVGLLIASCTH